MKSFLFTLFLLPVLVSASTDVESAMKKMATELVKVQKSDGRFEGAFEADPGFELLSLVLMKKYGHGDPEIEETFIKKALSWKRDSGFGYSPQGSYSHDVTGLVLLSLKALGRNIQDLGLRSVEEKFIQNGGEKKLNLGTKILLAPLDLISSTFINAFITTPLLGIPEKLPVSEKNLGIFRSLIIPVTTWNYYRHQNQKASSSYLKAPGDKNRAEEGIKWILDHQMPNGTWYTLFHAIVSISALHEAEIAGAGHYKEEIEKGLVAIEKWRTKNSNGDITQQITLTTGWDTPQSLIALSELPKDLKDNFKENSDKAISFLDENQIKEAGDWAIHSPDLKPGGWSFIVENRDYPDTDVVAAVLEAKNSFPEHSSTETFNRGLDWLLGLQNKDGGFPAWEKGVSHLTDKIIKIIFPKLPDYSDLSQADVTSRILRLLQKIKGKYPEKNIEDVIARGCRFIKDSKEVSGPYWKGRWLVAYLYGTSESVDTLLSTGCSNVKEVESSVAWLVSKQNSDGGFGESHTSFVTNEFVPMDSTVMQTSYVVQGLMAFEEKYKKEMGVSSPFRKNLDRAMKFLIERAEKDEWMMKERSFTGVIGAKLWYADYALGPQFMTLRALGRYSRLN